LKEKSVTTVCFSLIIQPRMALHYIDDITSQRKLINNRKLL